MQINLIFTRKVFHAISLVLKVKAFGTQKLRNGLLIHPQSQSKWKRVWRLGTITLMAHTGPADFQTQVRRSDCRVYSRNWPMRVKWAPFCNFRGAFLKKKRYKKGGTKSKYTSWVLFETFDILHGSDSSDALPPFRNILSNWESLGSNYTAESRMFVWWNDDSKEEEKGNCYSKRL